MHWMNLTKPSELGEIVERSGSVPQLIFKHSTRCYISKSVLQQLEQEWTLDINAVQPVFLDLIAHRDVSNAVADLFKVRHESPQALLIRNGEVIYHASHEQISADAISGALR
jgi:bacillithiol system protein YtxJ